MWSKIAEFIMSLRPIVTVEPNEEGIILRWGCLKRVVTEGTYWLWPIAERCHTIDVSEQILDVPQQVIMITPHMQLVTEAVIKYDIFDSFKARYFVQNYDEALIDLARMHISKRLRDHPYTSLTTSQQRRIESEILSRVIKGAENWGIHVSGFHFTSMAQARVYKLL